MLCSKCWLAEKNHLECLDRDHAASIGLLGRRDTPCRAMRAVLKLAQAKDKATRCDAGSACPPGHSKACAEFVIDGACLECWARWATR